MEFLLKLERIREARHWISYGNEKSMRRSDGVRWQIWVCVLPDSKVVPPSFSSSDSCDPPLDYVLESDSNPNKHIILHMST